MHRLWLESLTLVVLVAGSECE
ncbi:hypothetical protein [Porphyromonas sp.]